LVVNIKTFILDPLSVIVKLAIIGNKPIGTKILIQNNVISFQEPGYFQGISRIFYKSNKTDIQYLYNPIYIACSTFLSSEYLKEKFTEWEREGEDSEINLSHSNQHWNDESSTFDWDSTLSDGWDDDENDYNFVEPPNDNLKKAAEEFNKKITSFNKKVKKNKN
jgi:hypothetical protein